HARGQVAHVDLAPEQLATLRKPHGKRPPLTPHEALARRLNGILGPVADVVVLRAGEAPADLDADAMDLAAHGLLGLHDFASYCKAREGATTIRTLLDFSWRRDDDC